MNNLPQHKKIILFDGVCNLCNFFVQFVIQHDKADKFRFVSLQSELGEQIASTSPLSSQRLDSVLLLDVATSSYKNKSQAVFEVLIELNYFKWLAKLFSMFPRFVTDFIYDVIAKYRYRLFGKQNQCWVPTKELQSKFL
jgi:predicted DCC family thiol-disulfide oxidoreductase YuxK